MKKLIAILILVTCCFTGCDVESGNSSDTTMTTSSVDTDNGIVYTDTVAGESSTTCSENADCPGSEICAFGVCQEPQTYIPSSNSDTDETDTVESDSNPDIVEPDTSSEDMADEIDETEVEEEVAEEVAESDTEDETEVAECPEGMIPYNGSCIDEPSVDDLPVVYNSEKITSSIVHKNDPELRVIIWGGMVEGADLQIAGGQEFSFNLCALAFWGYPSFKFNFMLSDEEFGEYGEAEVTCDHGFEFGSCQQGTVGLISFDLDCEVVDTSTCAKGVELEDVDDPEDPEDPEEIEVDCDDDNPCTDDFYDSTDGCLYVNLSGVVCDDGDSLTTNDTCQSGECIGESVASCDSDEDCNDDNSCTYDYCNGIGECKNYPKSDGVVCEEVGTCADSLCILPCEDDSDCTDGKACLDSACIEVECETDEDCNDNNPCTITSCEDYKCSYVLEDNCCTVDADCDDDNLCTDDYCNSSGECVFSTIDNCCDSDSECNDNNPCTDDSCDNGECVFETITNCCQDDSDCDSGYSCDDNQCVEETEDDFDITIEISGCSSGGWIVWYSGQEQKGDNGTDFSTSRCEFCNSGLHQSYGEPFAVMNCDSFYGASAANFDGSPMDPSIYSQSNGTVVITLDLDCSPCWNGSL